ncbi:MAG: hypothetical protein PHO05_07850 [bacterium]|nr:hypothetical protein [bacterium]
MAVFQWHAVKCAQIVNIPLHGSAAASILFGQAVDPDILSLLEPVSNLEKAKLCSTPHKHHLPISMIVPKIGMPRISKHAHACRYNNIISHRTGWSKSFD